MTDGIRYSFITFLFTLSWITGEVNPRQTPYPTRKAYVCEGSMMDIGCTGGIIRILRANYGRYSLSVCNEYGVTTGWNLECGMAEHSKHIVGTRCEGRELCSIEVTEHLFGDPCLLTPKYLEVEYQCVIVTDTPPLKTPTVDSTTFTVTKTTTTASPESSTEMSAQTSTRPNTSTTVGDSSNRTRTTTSRTTTSKSVTSESTTKQETERPVTQFCKGTELHGKWWTPVQAGTISSWPCPEGQTGMMTWRCGINGWIGSPDLTNCVSEWMNNIDELLVSDTDCVKVAEIFGNQTAKKKMRAGDLKKATQDIFPKLNKEIRKQMMAFNSTQERQEQMQKFSVSVVRTGSNLLSKKQAESWEELPSSERSKVATSLVVSIEQAGFEIATSLKLDQTLTTNDENLLMEVSVINTTSGNHEELVFPTRTTGTNTAWSSTTDQISLPRESLHSINNGVVQVVFLMYNNLDKWMSPTAEETTQNDEAVEYSNGKQEEVIVTMETRQEDSQVINSKIFSASINNQKERVHLAKPITYTLAHNHILLQGNVEPHCTFWNIDENNYGGQWSSSGCRVVSSNATHTTCQCDHLTNFAVLMDVTGTKLTEEHRISLTAITYVGCIVSIICLICCLFTFSFFKNLQCDRNTIHKNLVLCLMLANLVFLIGIGLTENRVLCAVIAGVLHFLFLAAFSWMLLEGVQLYSMLIEVFEAEHSRRKWYYLAGYGFPVIIVGISAGIRHQGYGTENYCWLSTDYGLIWSFVGPVIVVITVNIVMLSMAVYMMCKHANTSALKIKEKSRLEKIRAWIKGAVVLVVLLGLTWAFGVLFLNQDSVVMAYIFTILNTLQGLFIFVFHCLMNEKVKKEYKKFVYRTTWLPSCLRTICVGYSSSTSHTPNNSDSSGGYLLKFWSKHKRKSSTSTYDRSSTNPRGNKRKSDLESYSSNGTNSALFSRTTFNPYSNNSKISDHTNGHLKTNDEIVGDLSAVDCSVIDSEYVSEYCHNNLQVSMEKRRYSSGSEDVNQDEFVSNRLSVLSKDSLTSVPSNCVLSEVDTDDKGCYLEPYTSKIHEPVVRKLSEYENAPLIPKTESEKNLLNDLLSQGQNEKQYPSMNEIFNTDTSAESINKSMPNLQYKAVV